MHKLLAEYRLFLACPWNMKILLITNMVYGFVLPIVEIFQNAYVMRNSQDVSLVLVYQLTVYTGIPLTFLANGYLLRGVQVKRLYSLGMLLSGVSMAVMMSLPELSRYGVGMAGLVMGMSFGLYWANRDYLALASTADDNRNYYYGLETFFGILTGVAVPALVGWFIVSQWVSANQAYHVVTAGVFVLTLLASAIVHLGRFENPPSSNFLYFRYHWLWNRFQVMAVLKGLAQGYIVTAPAMLVMQFLGKEGALGTVQSVGAIISAFMLYAIGRLAKPKHRIYVFSAGLTLFALAGLCNAALFDATGVWLFALCLLPARPLLDLAYFPIQMQVIDTVSEIEGRNKFTYIFNHEFGLYLGRFTGCGMFIVLANYVSGDFALRYVLLIIGVLQLFSILVAKRILAARALIQPVDQQAAELAATIE